MAELCRIMGEQPQVATWPFNLSVGNGGYYGLVKYYFGHNHIRRSILSTKGGPEEEYKFRNFLREKPIRCALEIGTFKGTATALLARYAERVITIDKYNFVDKFPFWTEFGVYDKIDSYVIKDEEDKADLIKNLEFDFAFIDGDHTKTGVKSDFDLVRKCGRVLFHDYYDDKAQGIVPVVNQLAKTDIVKIQEPFAYWEKR